MAVEFAMLHHDSYPREWEPEPLHLPLIDEPFRPRRQPTGVEGGEESDRGSTVIVIELD
jgi:hypothetical protein